MADGICLAEADGLQLAVRNLREYFPPRSYGIVICKGKYLSLHARAFVYLVRPELFVRRDYDQSGHSER